MHTTKSHEELYKQKEHDDTKSYTWKTVKKNLILAHYTQCVPSQLPNISV